MSKQIILKEYEFLQYKDEYTSEKKAHFVSEKIFLELEKFVLENDESINYLRLSTKKGFGKILKAQNYVGVIQTKDGTSIEILPKIHNISIEESKRVLLKMLATLKKSPFKHFHKAQLNSLKLPLLEIFISMFLEELTVLVSKGIRSGYLSKEENLYYLKGKLKIAQQLKKNSVHKERFYVEYEEFTNNRVENTLIKTTLHYLYKKSKLNKNQQKIRELLFIFDDIQESHNPKLDFKNLQLSREMKDY
jgi:5-methylcytosine-specific restriction enzyme subunit McrC